MQKIILSVLPAVMVFIACRQHTNSAQHASPEHSAPIKADLREVLADSFMTAMRFDSAIFYFQCAENQYDSLINFDQKIGCRRKRAHCLWAAHESEKSARLARECLAQLNARGATNNLENAKLLTILGNIYADKRTRPDFEKSLSCFNRAFEITRRHFGEHSPELAGPYERLGIAHWLIDDPQGAVPYFEKALERLDTALESSAITYTKVSNNAGLAYFTLGQYDKAYEAFNNARLTVLNRFHARDSRAAKYLANMAEAKINLGCTTESANMLREALDIETNKGAPGSHMKCYILEGLGNCAMVRADYPQAVEIYRECLGFWRPGNRDDLSGLSTDLQKLGTALLENGQKDEAVSCLKRAYALIDTVFEPENESRIPILLGLGRACARTNDYAAARRYTERALHIARAVLGDHHPHAAGLEREIAKIAFEEGRMRDAARLAAATHRAYLRTGDWKPGEAPVSAVTDLEAYIGLLDLMGQIEDRAPTSPGPHQLWYFRRALDYSDSLKNTLNNAADRRLAQKQVAGIAQHAVDALYRQWQAHPEPALLESLCFFMEKSKAADLLSAFHELDAQRQSGVPANLIEQEQNLKRQLVYLQNLLYDPAFLPNSLEKSNPDAVRAQLTDTRAQLDCLIATFKKQFPAYHNLQYNNKVADLSAFRTWVRKNGSPLLEYNVSEQNVDLLAVSPDTVLWFRLPIGPAQTARLDTLDAFLRLLQPEWQSDSIQRVWYGAYCRSAHFVYDWLLKPVENILKNASALTIVPDGCLSRLSFQALLTENVKDLNSINYRKIPYLVRRIALQYECSGTLLLEPAEHSEPGGYVGFAPQYLPENHDVKNPAWALARNGFTPLQFNTSEVTACAQITGGRFYTGPAATESQFKKQSARAGVLHLAMHANVDNRSPDYSALIFSSEKNGADDGNLFAFELYNLNLNAELAFLTACNTGAGHWEQGEGVMSLARAFKYAGCRAVLMSLWEADDAVSRDFSVDFFRILSTGADKGTALREAALLRFGKSTKEAFCHPHYWANFMLIGPRTPVALQRSGASLGLYLLPVLVLLLTMMVFYRRISSKTSAASF